jgi:hypothetical protein
MKTLLDKKTIKIQGKSFPHSFKEKNHYHQQISCLPEKLKSCWKNYLK